MNVHGGHLSANVTRILDICSRTAKTVVTQLAPEKPLAIFEHMRETANYVHELDARGLLKGSCRNTDAMCTFYAVIRGDCETNVAWMKENCGPACRACR